MADRTPISDTALEALQGIDLYNATLTHLLFEMLVKSGAVETSHIIDRIREQVGLLRESARIPAAAAHYETMSEKLIEDIELWTVRRSNGE